MWLKSGRFVTFRPIVVANLQHLDLLVRVAHTKFIENNRNINLPMQTDALNAPMINMPSS